MLVCVFLVADEINIITRRILMNSSIYIDTINQTDTCPQAANHCAFLSLRMNSSFITSRPGMFHCTLHV